MAHRHLVKEALFRCCFVAEVAAVAVAVTVDCDFAGDDCCCWSSSSGGAVVAVDAVVIDD